ncbi:unnamed protein product [Rotaria sp. Silwood1]|nr:unnamed protein product [Rotaria sp. Silwood1]CAF4550108.1 unnamed protein product [Rotaria sp. Silwood1]
MTSENDENKLKQCLQSIIDAISDTINNLTKKTRHSNQKQILNNLQSTIQSLLDDNLASFSSQCRNYIFDALNHYNYNTEAKAFDSAFTVELLDPFRNDLQGRLFLLDACQAAWNGDRSIIETFIRNYPTLKDKSGLYGTTLLYSAARNNHFHIVQYLIQVGKCSVNAQNKDYLEKSHLSTLKATVGSTALHAACFYGHLQIVEYLIQHGADYFILNAAFETPIDNGQPKANIRNFFTNFLVLSYSRDSNVLPKRTILDEIEKNEEYINDCFWEYKPFSHDRWFPFTVDASSRLQKALTIDSNEKLITEIHLKAYREAFNVSIVQFLRWVKNYDQPDNLAWVRCRGSSLLNFHCYSQWQIMFMKHPAGITNSSSPIQTFDMTTTEIQLNSWYKANDKINFLFERTMNYHRKYMTINLNFINNEKITFDFENFTFTNQQNTVEGFLRWIPKLILNDKKLILVNNFQLPSDSDIILLTTSYLKKAPLNEAISTNEMNQYNLKYDNVLDEDILDFPNKQPIKGKTLNKFLNVIQGDILREQSDVVVISTSSKSLLESIWQAGGKPLQKSFVAKSKANPKDIVISVTTNGQLPAKAVYFVLWEPNSDSTILSESLEKIVSTVMEKAASENYTSIAFPSIGCGRFGCSINLVAQILIGQFQQQLAKYPIKVSIVIHPDRTDIYNEFQRQINFLQGKSKASRENLMSIAVGQGKIEVKKGDITKQKVDVIIGSSSSENLRQGLLEAGGPEVESAYDRENQANPNSLIISTPSGKLPCERIFFLRWEPNKDPEILRQSIIDLIWNVIQNVHSHNYKSIAFPAIGCGEHACSVDIVVKTMVREMKKQIENRKLPWSVTFIIQPNEHNVYDEFCKQLLASSHEPMDYKLPLTWQTSKEDNMRLIVRKNTDEYKSIVTDFDQSMKKKYQEIIRIERIQNERWFMQYLAHARDFQKRLNDNTEKYLYHGCPESAASSIIQDCFNRSFAGVNGTAYGVGVYFSSNAAYSHGFTKPNSNGERFMFLARVLIGKTTIGNASMKTRPVGFDSTTDGNHIYVTYHDAQAYAEYLITYK